MTHHDIIIIGAGPGGYVAAIRAAQLGFNTAVIEKEASLGGTCVRVGCIPSKALLESSERYTQLRHSFKDHGIIAEAVKLDLAAMHERKHRVVKSNTDGVAFLFKKNKITHYQGRGEILAPGKVSVLNDAEALELSAHHIIIATGSQVSSIPGVVPDAKVITTSDEAINYPEVPKHLVVIGAGVIGLELGSVWNRLGAKVTVLEYFDRILPGMDTELSKEALKIFKKQGLEFQLGVRVTGAEASGDVATVTLENKESISADKVLVATGRKPHTEGLGLEKLGLDMDGPRIRVNAKFETSIPGIYAIGDVIHGPMLAHKAEEDGVACVEIIKTGVGHVDYNLVPNVVYTEPEIASVGQTEEQLKEAGISYKRGVFPYQANGRARALGMTEGKAKILADAKTDRVLGVHIIGARAGDLIAEAVAAMTFGASSEDIARTVHAHPTLAEIVREAALAVEGRALHS